jgi:hypothetical protein
MLKIILNLRLSWTVNFTLMSIMTILKSSRRTNKNFSFLKLISLIKLTFEENSKMGKLSSEELEIKLPSA